MSHNEPLEENDNEGTNENEADVKQNKEKKNEKGKGHPILCLLILSLQNDLHNWHMLTQHVL